MQLQLHVVSGDPLVRKCGQCVKKTAVALEGVNSSEPVNMYECMRNRKYVTL